MLNNVEKIFSPEKQIFSGEIKENPKKGKILIIAGYHWKERNWGESVQKALKEHIKDDGQHLIFLSTKNNEVEGGDISASSEKEIADFVKQNGGWDNFEAIVDIHDQHEEKGEEDMVRLYIGDNGDEELFSKELNELPRGGSADIKIVKKYHPRVNKDGWHLEKDIVEKFSENGIQSYGLSNAKIPSLGFDPKVCQEDVKKYLETGEISSKELLKTINSHLKIITKFSNLVLSENN